MLKGLVTFDIMERMFPEMTGWYISRATGKITAGQPIGISTEINWIHPNPDQDRCCQVYRVMAETLKFVPSRCMDCWKVVVKPSTVYELMNLYAAQKKFVENHIGKDRFCKCGIETREYVHYNYGGYFYTDSKKQGLYRYGQVRKMVDKINPKIPVILKRYCTEYELEFGPSNEYERPKGSDELEKHFLDAIDLESIGDNPMQTKFIIEHNIRKWMEFAWGRGDPTVTMFNDNEPLFRPSVTYHDRYADVEEELIQKYGGDKHGTE